MCKHQALKADKANIIAYLEPMLDGMEKAGGCWFSNEEGEMARPYCINAPVYLQDLDTMSESWFWQLLALSRWADYVASEF